MNLQTSFSLHQFSISNQSSKVSHSNTQLSKIKLNPPRIDSNIKADHSEFECILESTIEKANKQPYDTITKSVGEGKSKVRKPIKKANGPKKKKIRSHWSAEEDKILMHYISEIGPHWAQISSYMKTRTGKQIRDRYVNYLLPNISRSEFTSDEDDLIRELYSKIGNKWSFIAGHLPGRTENQVKCRFHTYLKKLMTEDELNAHPVVKREAKKRSHGSKKGRKKGGNKPCKTKENQSMANKEIILEKEGLSMVEENSVETQGTDRIFTFENTENDFKSNLKIPHIWNIDEEFQKIWNEKVKSLNTDVDLVNELIKF